MNNTELAQKALSSFFEDLEQKNREELQRSVDALAPLLGEEDAKIAVQLDHDIRTAGRRKMAEAGAEYIKARLAEPGICAPKVV